MPNLGKVTHESFETMKPILLAKNPKTLFIGSPYDENMYLFNQWTSDSKEGYIFAKIDFGISDDEIERFIENNKELNSHVKYLRHVVGQVDDDFIRNKFTIIIYYKF